ncbi:D-glycero-beta-D-manno-heptose 1-phosphate adenylyltransferase [Gryllotalpicola ginsengisoli]|uniref:D-glycero-beta-D-manno-heptose 1-phosphate adenylyltransferase n=1 Tax=Gryllotalpicola ginsengisoli TaxID=444608 RepID=UPI0003B36D79|nr:D-glycero-beta-D-manno-heptose 1-phosphate adenylyltransferase [Gryllotalpicola ginsengisoli]
MVDIATLLRRITEAAPEIVVVGDLLLDDWWQGGSGRLGREAPVPVVDAHEHHFAPGGAANAAANLAALGARVRVVGAVGTDASGDRLLAQLSDLGVDTSAVVRSPAVTTPCKTRIVARDSVVARVDEGTGAEVPAEVREQLVRSVRESIGGGAAQLICDYGLGAAAAARDELARAPRPALRVVDAHEVAAWADLEPDVVTPNRQEAAALLGADAAEPGSEWVQRSAERLLEASAARLAVAVTLDRDGSVTVRRDGAPAHRTHAGPASEQNASGAGDTYAAALTAALAAGCAVEDAAELGQLAADVVVRAAGTSLCRPDELLVAARGVFDREVLADIVAAHQRLGHRVVLTNGVFDVLHRGHAASLAEAKSHGDVLVVALNADASVRRLKGPERPINEQADRAAVIAALGVVDLVTIFEEDTPADLIERLRPDVYVKGGDYSEQMLAEARIVRSYGGEVHILGYVPEHSTTDVVTRIRRRPRTRRPAARWASAEPPAAPRLDVLIPTSERPAELAVTLAGLAAQDDPPFRVVIGDQSERMPDWEHPAAQAMIRVLRAQGRAVELLRTLPRRGVAEHRERLLQHSVRTAPEVEDVLFLDDDVWLEPGQLATLVAARRELDAGFVGAAVQGLSYLDDDRPHELEAFERWDGPVQPEAVAPETPEFERWRLHNAANLTRLAGRLQLADDEWVAYKVAWVGGCVLYDRAELLEAGGFDFWSELPPEHSGEDVVAQWRVMRRRGGAGIVPSGAVHLESPTTVVDRTVDAKDRIAVQ